MTAFLALLRRDIQVTFRSAFFLLSGTLTQPILVVLVFGNILPRLGLVADEFRTVLLPGLMAITMMMSGVQAVLMPLITDLSGSREVDERLLGSYHSSRCRARTRGSGRHPRGHRAGSSPYRS